MLQILFPTLFQTDELLDLLGEAPLPKLDMLLARGRRNPLASPGLEALLCRELGIARQQDWPLAPITLAQAGGQPGIDYWLRADPVHVCIEHDRLILDEIPPPPVDEANRLCEALAAHFGASFSPHPLRPDAWVVRIGARPDITTTPLSQAAGKHIDPLLPSGPDALHWRRLLNEAQMLLFSHPVNQARELRGEPAINSLWLWGGGCLPALGSKSRRTVFCGNTEWRALAEFAGAEVHMLPDAWSPRIPNDALIILDAPSGLLRQGNFHGWLKAMRDFENNWLRPLLASGRSFRMDDPSQGMSLFWRPAYRWKFWRRKQPAARQAFAMEAPADAGIDSFGNRYQ